MVIQWFARRVVATVMKPLWYFRTSALLQMWDIAESSLKYLEALQCVLRKGCDVRVKLLNIILKVVPVSGLVAQ